MTSSGSSSEALQRLVELGQLKAEAPSRDELRGFLRNAARLLGDARNSSNSTQTRFLLAYDAGHLLALAALRAKGFRPGQGPGHRAVVFQALAHTAGAAPEQWVPLSKAHAKRNRIAYGGLDDVSETETTQLVKSVSALEERVTAAVRGARPDLLG